MKKLLCKILGHNFMYNSTTYPTKCFCRRCLKEWKSVNNPNYNGKNLMEEDVYMWIEDNQI